MVAITGRTYPFLPSLSIACAGTLVLFFLVRWQETAANRRSSFFMMIGACLALVLSVIVGVALASDLDANSSMVTNDRAPLQEWFEFGAESAATQTVTLVAVLILARTIRRHRMAIREAAESES